MSREEFFAKLEPLKAERLRKTLWNLYWRGAAPLRERIEAEIEPERAVARRAAEEKIDGEGLLGDVHTFAGLVRSGAYMGGTRAVTPRERGRWRLTFRRLIDDATRLVEQGDLDHGAEAMEQLIDLANATRRYQHFHSDDPVAAMKLVVSDRVQALWRAILARRGFAEFVKRAAPQFVRWESRYGWTVRGFSEIAQRERPLASVLEEMLQGVDAWITFADAYLCALDGLVPPPAKESKNKGRRNTPPSDWESSVASYAISERTGNFAELHQLLLKWLHSTEAEDRLDRLATHAALGGPERVFLQAQLAHARGDTAGARRLVEEALGTLPGHPDFLEFAKEIGAKRPPERALPGARRREP